ncbi:MAG: FkbM family methyltransferase [Salinigranum sp.]
MSGLKASVWNVCDSLGLAPLLRKGYVSMRAAPRGWRRRATVGSIDAEFLTTEWIEYQRVRTFNGERHVLAAVLEDLTGHEVVWNVGANVGLYACFVARRLTTGEVVAFEPVPANETRLRRNLRANGDPARWRTTTTALSDRDETTQLATTHSDARRAKPGAGHHYLSDTDGWLTVEARRGDTLVESGWPRPDLLMIDVQGAELKVLRGLGEALDGVEVVYAELHTEKTGRYGTTADGVEEFLREAGYAVENLGEPSTDRRGVYFVRAAR